MTHKPIALVRLERQPHREAAQRLRRAYTFLIEGSRRLAPPAASETESKSTLQEVKS